MTEETLSPLINNLLNLFQQQKISCSINPQNVMERQINVCQLDLYLRITCKCTYKLSNIKTTIFYSLWTMHKE